FCSVIREGSFGVEVPDEPGSHLKKIENIHAGALSGLQVYTRLDQAFRARRWERKSVGPHHNKPHGKGQIGRIYFNPGFCRGLAGTRILDSLGASSYRRETRPLGVHRLSRPSATWTSRIDLVRGEVSPPGPNNDFAARPKLSQVMVSPRFGTST